MVRMLLRIINVQDEPSFQVSTGSAHKVTGRSGQALMTHQLAVEVKISYFYDSSHF